jgi:thiamine-monophosphate kinase
MKVSELGEFGLIDLLAEMVARSRSKASAPWQKLVIDIGDDTAAWQGDTAIQLATVDSLIEGVHFPTGLLPWREMGWKALAVNLSDIAAMGGIPRYALVSLALPRTTEVDDISLLYQGMIELAGKFNVAIVGGNITSAPQVMINITVLGSALSQAKNILTRATAKPGEKIAVTGYLGTAAAGLAILKRQAQADAEVSATLTKAFQQPNPRIAEGQQLVRNGVKTAIDISDGLLSDLNHICQASRVGAQVEIDQVPILPSVSENLGDQTLKLALAGGEDYELLFTANDEIMAKVKQAIAGPVTVIGEIVAGKAEIALIDSQGRPFDLGKTSWDHFAAR